MFSNTHTNPFQNATITSFERKKRLIRFQDNTEPDGFTEKDESKSGKPVQKEEDSFTGDVYKRKVLEEKRMEESSSRGEIFCGQKSEVTIEDPRKQKSEVTIEDVSCEDPRNQPNNYFQVVITFYRY